MKMWGDRFILYITSLNAENGDTLLGKNVNIRRGMKPTCLA